MILRTDLTRVGYDRTRERNRADKRWYKAFAIIAPVFALSGKETLQPWMLRWLPHLEMRVFSLPSLGVPTELALHPHWQCIFGKCIQHAALKTNSHLFPQVQNNSLLPCCTVMLFSSVVAEISLKHVGWLLGRDPEAGKGSVVNHIWEQTWLMKSFFHLQKDQTISCR